MCFISPSKRYPPERSASLRLEDLLPMLWRLPARLNFILPVAVKLKRFAAAFLVLIFILLSLAIHQNRILRKGATYFKKPRPVKGIGYFFSLIMIAALGAGFLPDEAGARTMISFLPSSLGGASTMAMSFTCSSSCLIILKPCST